MALSSKLAQREASGKPIQVALIGAGKFGTMFLSQLASTPGMRLAGIADLSLDRAREALKRADYPAALYDDTAKLTPTEAHSHGKGALVTSAEDLIAAPHVDVVLEVTGVPAAGIHHALLCCKHKKHVVMVNVEADVLAGPLLATRAREAGIIYSMAYGDQPALIAELVDWARAAGFTVVSAGKGTKHLPAYHSSTPDTVWDYYGLTPEQRNGLNPQMFNSFLDGTKSALEMAAVANACNLTPPEDGLLFPPGGPKEAPKLLKGKSAGGLLAKEGSVEVLSCLNLDGSPVTDDIRWGVYVVIKGRGEYARESFAQYGLLTDDSGNYAVQYKPNHLIGLELGNSVASIMERGEPTGSTERWAGDVVATAKRALRTGEVLDGEGGHMVYGKLWPAAKSLKAGALPIGLAHRVTLKADVEAGAVVRWKDVTVDDTQEAVKVRREMEAAWRDRVLSGGT